MVQGKKWFLHSFFTIRDKGLIGEGGIVRMPE
jgi:hypothetical protein